MKSSNLLWQPRTTASMLRTVFLQRFVLRTAIYPWCFLLILARLGWLLIRYGYQLARSDQVLILFEGGFGHTVTCLDVFRRLYRDQRLTVVVFRKPSHNPQIARLFPEVCSLFFTCTCTIGWGRWQRLYCPTTPTRQWLAHGIAWLLRCLAGTHVLTHRALYDLIGDRYVRPEERGVHHPWLIAWFRLIEDVPLARTELPAKDRETIWAAIERYGGWRPPAEKVACLYLRQKGHEATGTLRSGGSMANYAPAIRCLVDHGYMVLLTGDRDADADAVGTFERKLITAGAVGLDPGLFSLFAHTEARIWIGNNGGGTNVPLPNRTPMLLLDSFPFGFGFPRSRVHYKKVYDAWGRPVPLDVLLRHYAKDYSLKGMTVHNNKPVEMVAAVESFLQELATLETSPSQAFVQALPPHSFERASQTHISTPWFLSWPHSEHRSAGV